MPSPPVVAAAFCPRAAGRPPISPLRSPARSGREGARGAAAVRPPSTPRRWPPASSPLPPPARSGREGRRGAAVRPTAFHPPHNAADCPAAPCCRPPHRARRPPQPPSGQIWEGGAGSHLLPAAGRRRRRRPGRGREVRGGEGRRKVWRRGTWERSGGEVEDLEKIALRLLYLYFKSIFTGGPYKRSACKNEGYLCRRTA